MILHDELSDNKGLADIQQHVPESCRLIVIFGPAETTFGAAWKELSYNSGKLPDNDSNCQVGNPFPGIQLCVLNHFFTTGIIRYNRRTVYWWIADCKRILSTERIV